MLDPFSFLQFKFFIRACMRKVVRTFPRIITTKIPGNFRFYASNKTGNDLLPLFEFTGLL